MMALLIDIDNNERQFKNALFISILFVILKSGNSIDFREKQFVNILSMSSNSEKFNFFKSIDNNELQSWNI